MFTLPNPKIFSEISLTKEKNRTYEGQLLIYPTYVNFKSEKYGENFYFQSIANWGYIEEETNNYKISSPGIFIDYYNNDFCYSPVEDSTSRYTFNHKDITYGMFSVFLASKFKIFMKI
ncbi:hypothetical protein HZS_1350 [Henneguya salminicola]|nr:hypothetical protein HZS_1350 [Henneguya salminicola]